MSTTIKASYTVIPAKPTPNTPLWLSPSDQLTHWTETFLIYVYKEAPNHDAIEKMRDSLSKILIHYYPLAGRLSWIEGNLLQLNCNAKGVTLLEAESTKTLSSYGDFAPNDTMKKELTPTLDYTLPIEDIPLFRVQLTRFKGTKQGLVMGVVINHILCDGISITHFINSWAKLCKGVDALDRNEIFPFLDRTVLKSSRRPRFDHPELKPLPLLLGSSDTVEEQKHEKTAVMLKLTEEQVAKLKERTNNDLQQEGSLSRPYSTFEVVSAHVWKCVMKARGCVGDQPTVVRLLADIRTRLNPPLSMNYFGNALASTLTPTCFARDVMSNPLRYCARKIREAIELLTDDYVRSQLDFMQCEERLDWNRASYMDNGNPKSALFYGNPNLMIVSWMSMPVYEADFGWGKPIHYGPATLFPDGKVYIIRSSDGDGSLVVSVHLQIRHMELFKKFFYQDITSSPFFILTRSFMEFCILGTDNLPRTLLMYFANTPSSLSSYFPTVLCNSRQFNRTVMNQNLLHAIYVNRRNDLRPLNSTDFDDMIHSGAAFAQKFEPDDPVLDLIDQKILDRSPGSVVPGGWCLGEPGNSTCLTWGDAKILRPGTGSQRLEKAIVELQSNGTFRAHQCTYE